MKISKAKKQKNETVDLYQLEVGVEIFKDKVRALAECNLSSEARLQITKECERIISLIHAEAIKAMLRCSTEELSIKNYLHRFTDANEVQQFLWGVPPGIPWVDGLEEAAQALIAAFSAQDNLQYLAAEPIRDAIGYQAAIFESIEDAEHFLRETRLIELNADDHTLKKMRSNGGKNSAETRREEGKRAEILKKTKDLLAQGKIPRREIAGAVAKLTKVDPSYVRKILKVEGI